MSAESAPAWKSVRLAHEALKANRPQAALEHLDRAMWSQETNVKDPNAKTVVNHEMFEGRRSSEVQKRNKKRGSVEMKPKTTAERAVLVTTEHRGVFFGYAGDTGGEQIKLRASRLCLYWSADVKGFMGLASTGPKKGCRIGPPADITVRKITAVVECTPDAVAAWESAPWSG